MSRTLTYTFNAECPYLNRPHSISIDYAEILLCGANKPDYQKLTYSCDESDTCPFPSKDNYGRCPVYLESPSEPI